MAGMLSACMCELLCLRMEQPTLLIACCVREFFWAEATRQLFPTISHSLRSSPSGNRLHFLACATAH